MASRPLIVALVAAAALVVSIGVDAAMNRTFALDVRTAEGWRNVAQSHAEGGFRAVEPVGAAVTADANGSVRMRLTVDNGHPWGFDETYKVYVNGIEVARGALQAGARAEGSAEFDVPARVALNQSPEEARKSPGVPLGVEVRIGGTSLYGTVFVQEAA